MKKSELIEKYIEIVKHYEDKDAHTKGNVYICVACEKVTMTVYKDAGVTPFMLKCHHCGEFARSTMGAVNPMDLPVRGVWYRPDLDEFLKVSQSEQEHVYQGGLLYRELEEEKEDE